MKTIKICAIVGTLHKNSNTVYFVNKFIEMIKDNFSLKVYANVYTLSMYEVKECLGCLKCMKLGKCIQKDDMEKLQREMIDADIVIWGTPVYMDGISGVLKNFIDRLHMWSKILPMRGKYGIILSTSSHKIANTFVQDYLIWIQCIVGLMNIGAYNIYVDFPAQLYSDSADRIIEKYVQETRENMKSKIKHLQLEERYFKNLKKIFLSLEERKVDDKILQYWKNTGILYCESFQECVEKSQNCKIAFKDI